MFELNGKYNTAKVFTDVVDNTTISQILSLLNQESMRSSKIRIMPDCHAGKGCVVGTTMTIQDSVIPNLVGIDIGCGMLAVRIREHNLDLEKLDEIIHTTVPSGGGGIHEHAIMQNQELENLACAKKIGNRLRFEQAQQSLGSLGGGNHFIEVDKDAQGDLWLVIHSGSRHLGSEVCDFYQKTAYQELTFVANHGNIATKKSELVKELRAKGKTKIIQKALQEFEASYQEKLPDVEADMAYCTGALLEDYLYDMGIVQGHAKLNRQMIAQLILHGMGLHEAEAFDTIHNYIDLDTMILRKGSISAQAGERVLIPMNMRDGSLIAVGKGNPDWNFSAPHGAGRLYSRSAARASLSMEDYEQAMAGIYTTSIGRNTLDESPMAYKPMESILEAIKETVEVVDIIKPIYNFKAGNRIS